MASVDTGNSGDSGKKGQPKRMNLRVDFTPMVDMMMLLITFFMFCTTLSKSQVMDIVMPTKDDNLTEEDKNQVKASKAITVILGEDNIIYYYEGEPDYTNYNSLKVTDYSPEGLRAILTNRNERVIRQVHDLRIQRARGKITEKEFKEQTSELKNQKDGQVVVIKPTDASVYKNLVNVLDEMAICSIGKYAVVEMAEGDNFLVENYKTQGKLSAEAAAGS